MNDQNDTIALMVVADDFGMCTERTDAILQLHTAQRLSRTSLLVNGNDAVRAGQLARRHCVPVGLHFNLTEGPRLSSSSASLSGAGTPQEKYPSSSSPPHEFCLWRCATNCFLGKEAVLCRLSMAEEEGGPIMRQAAKATVRRELEAQLDAFVALTAVHDVWLDGHHHVQHIPLVFEVILECFREEEDAAQRERRVPRWTLRGLRLAHDHSLLRSNVPSSSSGQSSQEGEESDRRAAESILRSPFHKRRSVDDEEGGGQEEGCDCFGMPFWMRISQLAQLLRPLVPTHVVVPDAFLGFDIGGADCSAETLEVKLRSTEGVVPRDGHRHAQLSHRRGLRKIIELMITFDDPLLIASQQQNPTLPQFVDFSSEWRERELRFYLSNDFVKVLQDQRMTIF